LVRQAENHRCGAINCDLLIIPESTMNHLYVALNNRGIQDHVLISTMLCHKTMAQAQQP
jgi:hypothetical protein